RIGVRGNGMPIDSKISYFLLAELGNSGITNGGEKVAVTDASITLNHIPFLRVRIGLFKYPGSEEGLQAIQVADYINFTEVTNQLMLERFPNRDNYYKTNVNGTLRGNTEAQWLGVSPNGFERSVGAFRDIGVQIFDWINKGGWEHSYAFMMGNGNGLNFGDNNQNKTFYGYVSSEKIFNGKGGRREGLKVYAWFQRGLRAYDQDFSFTQTAVYDTVAQAPSTTDFVYDSTGRISLVHYTRTRTGAGFKYLKKPYRVSAEYIYGKGMIFLGAHKESFDMNVPGGNGNGLVGTANGWYVDAGWYIPSTPFELDFRYDVYNRLTGDQLEANYQTATIGGQYELNKKTRLMLNYAYRKASSATGNSALDDNLSGIGGRVAAQITALY
ncbi:MAG: hypothetical protein R3240_03885, partial [Gammaproteobacteria bacterium]|nr:hypothetical protein [Gammaproteobacteria bacterium]